MSSSFSATVTKLVGSLDANYITSSSDATQLSYTYSADSLDSSSNVTSLSFSSLANEISTSANAVELVVTALEGDFVEVKILLDGFSASEVLSFDFSKVASDVFFILGFTWAINPHFLQTYTLNESDASNSITIDIIQDNWKNFIELIPENYKQNSQKKRTGISGILAACLELTREGVINIMQKKHFDDILIKKNKWRKKKII